MSLTGGCQCGAIRYEATGPMGPSLHCYCRQCQKLCGAGHASQFGMSVSAVRFEGEPATFELLADSGNKVTSHFCPRCGSPIFKTTAALPELLFFHAVTLDDPTQFRPRAVVWTHRRQPWDQLDSGLENMGPPV